MSKTLENVAAVKVPVSVNGYRGHVDVVPAKRSSAIGYVSLPKTREMHNVVRALLDTEYFGTMKLSSDRQVNFLFRAKIANQTEADDFVENAERILVDTMGRMVPAEVPMRTRASKKVTEAVEETVQETVEERVQESVMDMVVETVGQDMEMVA